MGVHWLAKKAAKMAKKHLKGTVLQRLKREMITSSDVSTGKHETLGYKLNKLDNV